MSFDILTQRLNPCLISGTSFSDAGGRVSIKPASGETVLFFVIDDSINPGCIFRQEFGIVGVICDLLVAYAKENKKLICLVESKGKNIKRAVEQIINTFNHIRKFLKQAQIDPINWKAYIYQHGSSPNRTDRDWIKNQLEKVFGQGNWRVSRDSNLGNFLRL